MAPADALDVVIRITNFATARWKTTTEREGGKLVTDLEVSILLPSGERKWVGDATVYGWYSTASVGPHVVACALMALEHWLYALIDAKEPVEQWLRLILERSESVAFAGLLVALALKDPGLLLGPIQPLLSMWQIYQWEPHLKMDVNGVGMLDGVTWGRWGERVLSQVRRWREMDHRRGDTSQLAKTIMLSYADQREFFALVRAFWERQIEDGRAPESAALWVAQFDPDNYKLAKAQEGGYAVAEFQIPDDLRKNTEAAHQTARDGLLIYGFPMKCRGYLAREAQLSGDEVEPFWISLRELASLRTKFHGHPDAAYVAAGVMGGIAVMFALNRDFLMRDPGREQWCFDQIGGILQEAPRPQFDHPDAETDLSWEGFLAQTAAVFLSELPSDVSVRGLAAACICSSHSKTTGLFFRQAFELRKTLGSEFVALCNTALLWAALRWLSASITWNIRGESIQRWRNRLIELYVSGRITASPIEWARVSTRTRRLCFSFSRAFVDPAVPPGTAPNAPRASIPAANRDVLYRRTAPGLDREVISSAFAFASRIEDAEDEVERRRWLNYLDQALALTLAVVPPEESEGPYRRTPSPYDRWIMAQITSVCTKVPLSDDPYRLWRPILDLGSGGHHWVEEFARFWMTEGVAATPTPQAFLQVWREMLAYAQELGWTPGDERAWRMRESVRELLGWGFGIRTVGVTEFTQVVTSLAPIYETWGRKWISEGDLAAEFARFLTAPAASRLVPHGLIWLYDAFGAFSEADWKRDTALQDASTALLRRCWAEYRHSLRGDGQFRFAFDGLLNMLVNLNNGGALELRDLINRSTSDPTQEHPL